MIEIHVSGGLGVRLFQYMFGVILCELKNDTLQIIESDAYKKDYEDTKNRKYYNFSSLNDIFPNIKSYIQKENNYIENEIIVKGHVHDLNSLINHKGKIIIKGSGFQRYEYFKNHRNIIEKYLEIDEKKKISFDDNDVVIHYRLGDTCTEPLKKRVRHNEKYIGYHDFQNMSTDYFLDILKINKFNNIYVITDEPNHKNIDIIQKKYNCKIISKNQYDDFLFLVSAPNLIICHSTFSWWASFLSNAKKIYMPKTHHNNNIKYHAEWIYRDDICLHVTDMKKFVYI